MKWLLIIIISFAIFIELIVRFLFAPFMEEKCLQKEFIFSPAREKVCSCFKDKIISERYYVANNITNDLVNGAFEDGKAKSQFSKRADRLGGQCLTMQDDDVKKHIEQTLHKDVGKDLAKLLSSTDRSLLEDVQITSYNIRVLPKGMHRYVVDVEIAAKIRVFFGVVEYQSYQGELYYFSNGKVDSISSRWQRSKNRVDPSGLFNGIKQAKEFFDEN